MEHEGGLTGQDADSQHHRDGPDQRQHSTGRSIRPGTVVPPTVFVADMGGPSGDPSEAL